MTIRSRPRPSVTEVRYLRSGPPIPTPEQRYLNAVNEKVARALVWDATLIDLEALAQKVRSGA